MMVELNLAHLRVSIYIAGLRPKGEDSGGGDGKKKSKPRPAARINLLVIWCPDSRLNIIRMILMIIESTLS